MCCSEYKFCLYVVFYTLAQSVLHLSFCSWALKYYYCKFKPLLKTTFTYFWYITYLYSESCMNAEILPQLPENIRRNEIMVSSDLENLLVYPSESESRETFGNIFSAYVFLDTLWIVATIILLIGVILKPTGLYTFVFFIPWSVFCMFETLMDVLCSLSAIKDIPQTYTLDNWYTFFGLNRAANKRCAVEILNLVMDGYHTATPAVMMLLVFSRFIIGWLVNVVLLFCIMYIMVKRFKMCLNPSGLYCAYIESI